jgi:hypothetical protein
VPHIPVSFVAAQDMAVCVSIARSIREFHFGRHARFFAVRQKGIPMSRVKIFSTCNLHSVGHFMTTQMIKEVPAFIEITVHHRVDKNSIIQLF